MSVDDDPAHHRAGTATVSESAEIMRRAVAWLGHAPGLWLCYRESIPPPLRRPNVIAAAMTLVAIAVAVVVAPAGSRGWAAVGAWGVGHVAWGTYLAWRLPARSR